MDLKELSRLDIKDLQKIDYSKVLSSLMGRPDALIAAVCVIVAVILSFGFFSQRHQEAAELRTQIREIEQKIAQIEKYQKTKDDLQALLDNMPQGISEEALVNRITDLAEAHQIRIESYTPTQKDSQPLYDTAGIMLKVSTSSYDKLWDFVKDIERGDTAVRIDGWHGNILAGNGPDAGVLIQATMEITAVTFKDR